MNYYVGSFKDPAARIVVKNDKVYRLIYQRGEEQLQLLRNNELISKKIKDKDLISFRILNNEEVKDLDINDNFSNIIEHPKINYISYPYEWSFNQLKKAALFYLDFHLDLLKDDISLKDSSAFNVQFLGSKCIFIDLFSIEKFNSNKFWPGYSQFCEQFLNPLILQSKTGMDFNLLYKSEINGIPTSLTSRLLPLRKKITSRHTFINIFLLDLIQKFTKNKKIKLKNKKIYFNKEYFTGRLKSIKKFIDTLNYNEQNTTWSNYSQENFYSKEEENEKVQYVNNNLPKLNIEFVCDLGCNEGKFSEIACNHGAKYVVGFDNDHDVLNKSFLLSENKNLDFLPLYMDLTNPSSDSGWFQNERLGMLKRFNFDTVICLAFIHHLVIGKNIPLDSVLDLIFSISQKGIIEFVPKKDMAIKTMLQIKDDIYDDYTEKNFLEIISKKAKIIDKKIISKSGRLLVTFKQ
jgi:ribosomal protein L11 methylase PrmA